jgi:4-amino-4-deoxy-L-arabinose transferase-like glycosyltransferase
MSRLFTYPAVQVVLLVALTAGLVFPNLGATSLWDDDEGVNAECTREMMETGTWIVPTFNWQLRTAKPIMLYWLMRGSFTVFGVNEWSARLPSALVMFGIVLLTYDLARRMYGSTTGLLAGVITATTLELVKLAHAATTDSTLICFTVLYFWAFWRGMVNDGRGWFIPCGIASGLMMLTKGPAVGLILPSTVILSYFLGNRKLKRVYDRRMIGGVLAWILVVAPWYVFVAAETKGEWPRAFFWNENLGRASEPMENHWGVPVLYEFLVICLLFAPWSGFLVVTVWTSLTSGGRGEQRLLLLWLGVYFLACSAAQTKLPHYIAPAYPALAILTAHFLIRWVYHEITPPWWAIPGGMVALLLTGLVVTSGMLIADGITPISSPKMRVFPGLLKWAWIGLIPMIGAVAMNRYRKQDHRPRVVISLATSTVLFVGLLAAFPLLDVDRQKAVKVLVEQSGARQLDRETRVGSFDYTRPSLTFYVGRRVERFTDAPAAAEFLAFPIESYLFIPEPQWEQRVKALVTTPHRVIANKYDYDRNCTVLVVTNR